MTASRLYPERPILAASVAVFRGEEALLIARAAPPLEGLFSLPGGVVERGESLEEAALRELYEETRVRARILGFNDHVALIERDEEMRVRRHFVIASFVGVWISGEGETGPEAGAILWTKPSQIAPERLTPGLAPLLDRARLMAAAR